MHTDLTGSYLLASTLCVLKEIVETKKKIENEATLMVLRLVQIVFIGIKLYILLGEVYKVAVAMYVHLFYFRRFCLAMLFVCNC